MPIYIQIKCEMKATTNRCFVCPINVPLGPRHYNDVIMGTMASQIDSLTIVFSTVYSDADQRKNQSSASLAFMRGIHRGPVNSPHKWPVTRKMFPFDDVIMVGAKIFGLRILPPLFELHCLLIGQTALICFYHCRISLSLQILR